MHALNEDGDQFQMVAQGTARFRIHGWLNRKRPFMAEVSYPEPRDEPDDSIRAYGMAIINTIKELLPLNPLYNEGLRHYLQNFSPHRAITAYRFRRCPDQRQRRGAADHSGNRASETAHGKSADPGSARNWKWPGCKARFPKR